jgi:hypothetical protein
MDPILDKARAGQNALEQLVNSIPGFAGYQEKELRRDADRIQREFLASRLETGKKALDAAATAASRTGALDAINDIETARKRLDKVANRIRYADRGYAGFFDAIKVKEDVLDRVYRFDLDLLGGVDAALQAASSAATSPQGVRAMTDALDALDSRLTDREAVLSGIQ